MDQIIKDLSLLLLYLTGWEEESRLKPGEKSFCSWKGYSFKALGQLGDEKLINEFKNSQTKLITLTDAGQVKAEALKKIYLEAKNV